MYELTRQLIDRIAVLTKDGQIAWRSGPSQNAFSFDADGYSVTVDSANAGPMLSVSDGEGQELEVLTGEELSETQNGEGLDYETVVRAVHADARRAALGTDDAINRILSALTTDEAGRPRFG